MADAMSGRGEVPWSATLRLAEAARAPVTRRIVADEAARSRVARALGLDALDSLEAELRASPWLDGAVVDGRWRAEIVQTCGVTLEPFGSVLEGTFRVRVLPRGSPNAPPPAAAEIDFDLEAEDPPDLIDDNRIDLGAYVVEHLALEIDPFPRKPGAVFTPPEDQETASPFAVLRDFKPGPKGG